MGTASVSQRAARQLDAAAHHVDDEHQGARQAERARQLERVGHAVVFDDPAVAQAADDNPVQGDGVYAADLPRFGGLKIWDANPKIVDEINSEGF